MINHNTWRGGLVLGILFVVGYPIYAVYWMYQDYGWGIFHLITYQGFGFFLLFIFGIMLIVFSRRGLKLPVTKKVVDEKK